jgi:hypothetical protein
MVGNDNNDDNIGMMRSNNKNKKMVQVSSSMLAGAH